MTAPSRLVGMSAKRETTEAVRRALEGKRDRGSLIFELALLGERRQRRSGDGGRAEGPVHSHSSCSGLHDDSWLWGRNEARGMAGMPERPARSIRRPR